jgi:uncharacterized protein (TIGR03067 family)
MLRYLTILLCLVANVLKRHDGLGGTPATAQERVPPPPRERPAIVDEAARRAQDRLQGTWKLIALENEGVLADETDKGEKLVFRGNQLTILQARGGETQVGEVRIVEARDKVILFDYFVNEGPNKGAFFRAIVEVNGDLLHYCYNANPGGERPATFNSRPNAGLYHSVWKR